MTFSTGDRVRLHRTDIRGTVAEQPPAEFTFEENAQTPVRRRRYAPRPQLFA